MSTFIQSLAARLSDEPVLLASALLSVAALVGVTVDPSALDGVTQVVAVLAPLVAGLFARRKVTPARRLDHES